MIKKAVVLLSGGVDSATTLYIARRKGFRCFCLIFDYGQRHHREIKSAKAIAQKAGCKYQIIKIKLPWGGSALLDNKIAIPVKPVNRPTGRPADIIPSTYVPGRNIVFLSFALSFAETVKAEAIFIGAHAQDYSGYPDCRPEFFRAFNSVIAKGTKAGVESKGVEVITPIIHGTKSQIIKLGLRLGVPFKLTWSCYRGGNLPCGKCDSCYYRKKGFEEAGIEDPISR